MSNLDDVIRLQNAVIKNLRSTLSKLLDDLEYSQAAQDALRDDLATYKRLTGGDGTGWIVARPTDN